MESGTEDEGQSVTSKAVRDKKQVGKGGGWTRVKHDRSNGMGHACLTELLEERRKRERESEKGREREREKRKRE